MWTSAACRDRNKNPLIQELSSCKQKQNTKIDYDWNLIIQPLLRLTILYYLFNVQTRFENPAHLWWVSTATLSDIIFEDDESAATQMNDCYTVITEPKITRKSTCEPGRRKQKHKRNGNSFCQWTNKQMYSVRSQSRSQSLLTSYGACSTKTKGSRKDRF